MKDFMKKLGIAMWKVLKDSFFVGVGVGCTLIGVNEFKKDAGIIDGSTNIVVLNNDSKEEYKTEETK